MAKLISYDKLKYRNKSTTEWACMFDTSMRIKTHDYF